jgi:tetratricopeptide (TPR) repeat protein
MGHGDNPADERAHRGGQFDHRLPPDHLAHAAAAAPFLEVPAAFLGWSMSFQGRFEEATAECLRAIEIDPDFGNPYNDIGVYLMQQARRYEPRQFPFMNLGRVYLKQGRWWEALREFEGACRRLRATRMPRRRFISCVVS